MPDYRGGLNFAKGFGSLAGSSKAGFYYETTADAIYVSRFGKDWLFYSQNRAGRTIPIGEGNALQLLWNGNVVEDMLRQYWANTLETGPGLRFRPSWLPKYLFFGRFYARRLSAERLIRDARTTTMCGLASRTRKQQNETYAHISALLCCSGSSYFQVDGANPVAWTKILGSVEIPSRGFGFDDPGGQSFMPSQASEVSKAYDQILILEGDSAAARSLGVMPQKREGVRSANCRHARAEDANHLGAAVRNSENHLAGGLYGLCSGALAWCACPGRETHRPRRHFVDGYGARLKRH